jgi:hypothetical protein
MGLSPDALHFWRCWPGLSASAAGAAGYPGVATTLPAAAVPQPPENKPPLALSTAPWCFAMRKCLNKPTLGGFFSVWRGPER